MSFSHYTPPPMDGSAWAGPTDGELQRCVSWLATAPSARGVGAIKAEKADNVTDTGDKKILGIREQGEKGF